MAGLAYNYKFHRFEPKSVEMKMTLIYTNEWKIRIEHEDTKIIYKK
jgi:hypothetical protein